jgi:hypothetical protein
MSNTFEAEPVLAFGPRKLWVIGVAAFEEPMTKTGLASRP